MVKGSNGHIESQLSPHQAMRLIGDLERATARANILLDVLIDLPPADIDVVRGLIRIVEQRGKDAGKEFVNV